MDKNQKGFHILETSLILVVVGLIGVVGFLTYNKNRNRPQNATSAIQSVQIPNGWIEYKASGAPFKFAYPSSWGQLTEDESNADLVVSAVNEVKDPVNDFEGNLEVHIFNSKENYTIMAGNNNNPLIKPRFSKGSIEWVVATRGTIGPAHFEPNDPFNVPPEKTNGLSVYDFSYDTSLDQKSDVSCQVGRWVVELKDKFVEITLPQSCINSKTDSDAEIAESGKLYYKIVNNLTKTFSTY